MSIEPKCSNRLSITALTTPEASIAGGMAVSPPLGMNYIGDTGAGSADGEFVGAPVELTAFEVINQWFNFGLVGHQELYVVSGGETQVTVAVLICDFAHLANVLDAHESCATDSDRIDLVAAFCHMNEDSGFEDIVVQPFTEVLFDYRRKEFSEISGTYIGNSILKRIAWIVRHV